MIMVVGEAPIQSKISAVDSQQQLLTSVERIEFLYGKGMKFEALVSQMVIVEALLLFYLLSRIQADDIVIREDIEELRRKKRLTFGKVKDIILQNDVFKDIQVQADLKDYVKYRNSIAHRLLSTFESVDLEAAFQCGRRLSASFHQYLLAVAKRNAA